MNIRCPRFSPSVFSFSPVNLCTLAVLDSAYSNSVQLGFFFLARSLCAGIIVVFFFLVALGMYTADDLMENLERDIDVQSQVNMFLHCTPSFVKRRC